MNKTIPTKIEPKQFHYHNDGTGRFLELKFYYLIGIHMLAQLMEVCLIHPLLIF